MLYHEIKLNSTLTLTYLVFYVILLDLKLNLNETYCTLKKQKLVYFETVLDT